MEVSINYLDDFSSCCSELIQNVFLFRLLSDWLFENVTSEMSDDFCSFCFSFDSLVRSLSDISTKFSSLYESI